MGNSNERIDDSEFILFTNNLINQYDTSDTNLWIIMGFSG